MTELFEFLIILFIIVLACLLSAFLIKRIRALFSVLSLAKINSVSVRMLHPINLLLPFTSRRPTARITAREKHFDVYLYHGGGRTKFVHIASDRYTVVFSKRGGMTAKGAGRGFGTKKRVVVNLPTGVSHPKVRLLPRIESTDATPILLFCPAPHELTFVTPERTSIRVAFTGDKIGRWQIFTPDTLARYIDRESRGFYD